MKKALSIKQPWASLICTPREDNPLLGIKDIENRTWKTSYRGKVLIHASGKLASPIDRLGGLMPNGVEQVNGFDWYQWIWNKDYLKSAIIGEVDIVDCVVNHPSIWAEKSPFCPITGLPFFMEIENEGGVMVRTYGGPFDSYTIPEPDDTAPGEFYWDRYCHDRGAWVGSENIPEKFHKDKNNKPIYNWVLANAVLYDKPILNVKGKLSFWEFNQ